MFIAITGTRFAGKSTIEEYLVAEKGFTSIQWSGEGFHLAGGSAAGHGSDRSSESADSLYGSHHRKRSTGDASKRLSFLSLDFESDLTPIHSPVSSQHTDDKRRHHIQAADLLDFVTANWRQHFVTCDLRTKEAIEPFIRRPFFLLVKVSAPILVRYNRSHQTTSLEDFIAEDDNITYAPGGLEDIRDLIDVQINNNFQDIQHLYSHLEDIDLLHPDHLRPSWDQYFMTLASLASRRSNCMKRRVGAILVKDNRILATGYNGTARNLRNCSEGGCRVCNKVDDLRPEEECVCLHAEENALLGAGRDRLGDSSVLYCNTCPCLRCTTRIIQQGVKEVVYNLQYKVDRASQALFEEAGVILRRYDPMKRPSFAGSVVAHDEAKFGDDFHGVVKSSPPV